MNKENRKLYRSLYFSSLSNQNLLELFHREKSSFFYLKLAAEQLSLKAFQGTLNLNDSNAADQV